MDKQGMYEASESDLQGMTPQEYPSQGKKIHVKHIWTRNESPTQDNS